MLTILIRPIQDLVTIQEYKICTLQFSNSELILSSSRKCTDFYCELSNYSQYAERISVKLQ